MGSHGCGLSREVIYRNIYLNLKDLGFSYKSFMRDERITMHLHTSVCKRIQGYDFRFLLGEAFFFFCRTFDQEEKGTFCR